MRIYSFLTVILRISQVQKHSDLNLRFPATYNMNVRSNSAVMTVLLEKRQRQPYRDHQIGWGYTESCAAAVLYMRQEEEKVFELLRWYSLSAQKEENNLIAFDCF